MPCAGYISFSVRFFLFLFAVFNPNAYLCTAKHRNQLGEAHNVRSVRGLLPFNKGAYPRVMSVMDLQPS